MIKPPIITSLAFRKLFPSGLKSLSLGLAFCFSTCFAQASPEISCLSCTLESGKGPLKNFQVFLPLIEARAGLTTREIDGEFSIGDSTESLEQKETGRGVKIKYEISSLTRYTFYSDYDGDWAATRIGLQEDDAGFSALAYFYSDGPTLVSFYRCQRTIRENPP